MSSRLVFRYSGQTGFSGTGCSIANVTTAAAATTDDLTFRWLSPQPSGHRLAPFLTFEQQRGDQVTEKANEQSDAVTTESSRSRFPDPSDCSAPERTEELTKEVFSVIESIQKGEVSDSNMTKIRELTIRGHETSLKQNNRWLAAMMDADEDGRDQRDFLRTPDRMLKVTKEQIRDAARLYLRNDRYARFTLLPATEEKKMVP